VRAPNMADSLSQYSKHSDDLAQNSVIQAMMDPETKSRVSGVNHKGGNNAGAPKNEKFVKTMKKLPDVKMGHLEGKNLTFSSDSEDPNFVSSNQTYLLGELTSYDQGRRHH
jgi:hypothetical protein